jgi:hypothetical protein
VLAAVAGGSFGIQAEVRIRWRVDRIGRLDLLNLNEQRFGVSRGGINDEMLRADVVFAKSGLIAVFGDASADIHELALLGADYPAGFVCPARMGLTRTNGARC